MILTIYKPAQSIIKFPSKLGAFEIEDYIIHTYIHTYDHANRNEGQKREDVFRWRHGPIGLASQTAATLEFFRSKRRSK